MPVNEYLYRLNILRTLKCILCNNGAESLDHLFHKCSVVNPIWDFIQYILFKIANDTVTITVKKNLFNIFQKSKVSDYNTIFIILVAEARWAIWFCRNKFHEANVTCSYVKIVFVHNIQLRIKADYKRLPLVKFECLWASDRHFLYFHSNSYLGMWRFYISLCTINSCYTLSLLVFILYFVLKR